MDCFAALRNDAETANHYISVMSPLLRPILTAFAIMLALAASSHAQSPRRVDLRILAINDFHGYLRPPPGGITIADPEDKTKKITVPAGGAEHMATLVGQLREGHRNTIFVAAGDLIGASPFLSAMFHDEPTIEALSMMGLNISSVGNHEFDEGKDELLRMQNGGCHPVDQCQGPHPLRARNSAISPPARSKEQRQDRVSCLTKSASSTAFRSPSSA